MESILTSVKKALGITEAYEQFDPDIIIHINSVLSILSQLGVGPDEGFLLTDKNAVWTDFRSDYKKIAFIKTYVILKVRLLFDPPTSNGVMESIKETIKELEWRISVEI